MEGFKVSSGRDSMVFYIFVVLFVLGYGTLVAAILLK